MGANLPFCVVCLLQIKGYRLIVYAAAEKHSVVPNLFYYVVKVQKKTDKIW
jgi:hypothetical protein